MGNEITKCPMCGTKLKMNNGKMTCQKCGYYVRSQSGQTDFQNSGNYGGTSQYGTGQQYGSAQQTGTPNQNYYSRQSNTSGYGAPTWQTGTGGQNGMGSSSPQKKNNSSIAIILAVAGGILTVAVLIIVALINLGSYGSPVSDRSTQSASAERPEESSAQPTSASQILEVPSSEETTPARAPLPQSDFFRQVAEAIWGKAYRTITAEEYASLTAIQISRDDKSIRYWLSDGDYQTLTYQNDIGMDLADLASFPGLGWISVDDDLDAGDLNGLNDLYGVYAENTIDELLKIIPNPENITELGIKDSIFERNLDGLESFPNLLYLYADYESLEDISILLQFPDLIGLALLNCDRLTDYSPLMSLTALDELTIESSQLKSIDFVKNMPALTKLSVEDSQISSLSALESCPNLTYLSLIDNYGIDDYSIVGQLDQLVDLTLEMQSGGVLPSFANLNQLEWLTIKYAGDLSPLRDATSVTYLSLERCSGWELDAVASMQELNTVIIHDFSSYVTSLEPLTRLPNLTALSLDETSVFGNVEEIFGIPTLEYLYIDDCQIGLDFDNIPVNETLTVLSLDETAILYDPTYNNGDKVSLSEHYDMFDCFPNLTELYLTSLNLDSIDFVEKLPYLQYLDITDNSVTSLKPLESLNDFRVVWCGKNTILENVSADSNITVYTD